MGFVASKCGFYILDIAHYSLYTIIKTVIKGAKKMSKIKDIKDTRENKAELDKQREYSVVKANDLIQKTRFDLTAQEQKIILYMISKIKPDDDDFMIQNFSISEFCRVCGIDYNSGGNYEYIKRTIQNLRDKSFWIKIDKTKILMSWINSAHITEKSGTIKIRLSEDMKPFLLHLRDNFTQYELIYTLGMRSQYSIRLYEILKSYAYQRVKTFDIDELKSILSAEKYTRFPDFKKDVLEIALRDINDLTDIEVDYTIIKVGRRYAKIEFNIEYKRDREKQIETVLNIKQKITKIPRTRKNKTSETLE